MAVQTPHPPSTVPRSPAQPTGSRSTGASERRLAGGSYALVIALVVVGLLWLLFVGFALAYAGVDFFSSATFVCVVVAVLAIPFRSVPNLMSVLLSVAAAGVVLIAGFNLGDTTNVGSSGVCSDDFANAIARVPDSYWTWWILLGGLAGVAMVVGALLTPRAIGSGLLGVGGWALGVGTFLLWVFVNSQLERPAGCGRVAIGDAILYAGPVALLALAAVIPAVEAEAATVQTTQGRPQAEEPLDEEALWRW